MLLVVLLGCFCCVVQGAEHGVEFDCYVVWRGDRVCVGVAGGCVWDRV